MRSSGRRLASALEAFTYTGPRLTRSTSKAGKRAAITTIAYDAGKASASAPPAAAPPVAATPPGKRVRRSRQSVAASNGGTSANKADAAPASVDVDAGSGAGAGAGAEAGAAAPVTQRASASPKAARKGTNKKPKQPRKPRATSGGASPPLPKTHPPTDVPWKQHWDNIVSMRKDRNAPVDHVGCAALPDNDLPDPLRRYQVLVSLMLSSLTKDELTAAAVAKLKALPGGLTPHTVAATSVDDIRDRIRTVGFYNTKATHLQRTSQVLLESYGGDIPCSVKELTALPGVGPKMAYLAMLEAWGKPVGIGVDVHVHRVSNTLGWVKTTSPEKTRVALESWLPESYWKDINVLFVGFGQTVCNARKPLCGECLNRSICPVGRKWKPKP